MLENPKDKNDECKLEFKMKALLIETCIDWIYF